MDLTLKLTKQNPAYFINITWCSNIK